MPAPSSARSDHWLQLVTRALGPHAPPVPKDALGYLNAFLHWIEPPHRSAMALVVADSIGLHAARHGWAEVRRTLLDDPSVDIPHRGSFPWVVQRMIVGANELTNELINAEPMQLALHRLFTGSDLRDLSNFSLRWKHFATTAGAPNRTEESLPLLIGDTALVGGAVVASEINSRDRAESVNMGGLWESIAARTCLAFHLAGENGATPITFHRNAEGIWSIRRTDALIDVELHAGARELLARIVSTMDAEPDLDARYREVAERQARYAPGSPFYLHLRMASEDELAEVSRWFPVCPATGPITALKQAWQSGSTLEQGGANDKP